MMGDLPPVGLAELQRQLDAIATRCELHRYHHRIDASSLTEAVINPFPWVRALPPPMDRIACVREALKAIPGVKLHGYSD